MNNAIARIGKPLLFAAAVLVFSTVPAHAPKRRSRLQIKVRDVPRRGRQG
ncbi:MAG TPA: hypothetical protein VKS44_06195 [Candidatus Acidoferrales bacterium]|nr:hypothetical protein [Candidatus Acidoferrales bacterium]